MLDALTEVVYLDDAQVVEVLAVKRYADIGRAPHVTIRVEETPGTPTRSTPPPVLRPAVRGPRMTFTLADLLKESLMSDRPTTKPTPPAKPAPKPQPPERDRPERPTHPIVDPDRPTPTPHDGADQVEI